MHRPCLLLFASAVFAACMAPPTRPWLRYTAADSKGWDTDAGGVLRSQCGPAAVRVDLDSRIVRLEVHVENPTDRVLVAKVGAQGGRPQGAIGEVRRRPLGGQRAEDVPAVMPYLTHAPIEVRPGWRATFELDSLLGREVTLGQYVVLEIEVGESGQTRVERRILPLQATNVARDASGPLR
jgi:hypothetical protein